MANRMDINAQSLFMPGVKVLVCPFAPPDTFYAISDTGLPADVEARLGAMPDGPERDMARFVELAKHGRVVVGKNIKLP